MPQKTDNPLSQFMKKQIGEKSNKNIATKQSLAKGGFKEKNKAEDKKEGEEQEKDEAQEEMTEEEQLEEAKKASKNKAAEQDQTEMFKKLIMESIIKYTVILSVLLAITFGLIKLGPAISSALGGLIHNMLMGALNQK